jgi:hypothetical protein
MLSLSKDANVKFDYYFLNIKREAENVIFSASLFLIYLEMIEI